MFGNVEPGQWTGRKEIGVAITANLMNPVIAPKSGDIPSKRLPRLQSHNPAGNGPRGSHLSRRIGPQRRNTKKKRQNNGQDRCVFCHGRK